MGGDTEARGEDKGSVVVAGVGAGLGQGRGWRCVQQQADGQGWPRQAEASPPEWEDGRREQTALGEPAQLSSMFQILVSTVHLPLPRTHGDFSPACVPVDQGYPAEAQSSLSPNSHPPLTRLEAAS